MVRWKFDKMFRVRIITLLVSLAHGGNVSCQSYYVGIRSKNFSMPKNGVEVGLYSGAEQRRRCLVITRSKGAEKKMVVEFFKSPFWPLFHVRAYRALRWKWLFQKNMWNGESLIFRYQVLHVWMMCGNRKTYFSEKSCEEENTTSFFIFLRLKRVFFPYFLSVRIFSLFFTIF